MVEETKVPVTFVWQIKETNDSDYKQEKYFEAAKVQCSVRISGGERTITLEKKVNLPHAGIPKEGEKIKNIDDSFFPTLWNGDFGFYKGAKGYFEVMSVTRAWEPNIEDFAYTVKLWGSSPH